MPKFDARSGQIKMETVVGRNIRALRQARNLTWKASPQRAV
jgi:hypothetical protein